ncbi:MAG TPA: hypothetical protein VGF27_14340 [Pseudoduganella sp.]
MDIFVDKVLLTSQTGFNDGLFNKLPVAQAENFPNKISDLESHQLSHGYNVKPARHRAFGHQMCITIPAAVCIAALQDKRDAGSSGGFFAALGRLQQHTFDNVGMDVVGLHVFDRAKRAETFLNLDASVHDLAAEAVCPLGLKLQGVHGNPLATGLGGASIAY